MSLLSNAMETCRVMDKKTVSDGRGGFTAAYTDGAEFDAAITLDTSTAARVAEKDGVKNLYTVATSKNVYLEPQAVFKRLRDGKYFKVTSDGQDKTTPKTAAIDMRIVSAMEYVIGGNNG